VVVPETDFTFGFAENTVRRLWSDGCG